MTKRREHEQQPGTAGRRHDNRPGVWVAYGKLLKLSRKKAGVTQEQLAEAVGYSLEQTASIEQGRRPAKAAFTEAAERFLDAGGVLDAVQEEVDFAKLPSFFRDFAVLELDAVSHYSYEPLLVPGLLQTEGYARALFESRCPKMSEELVEQNVEARLGRQKLITKTPSVEFSFVVGEAALRNPVGGGEVMREQMRHLLKLRETGNVEVQVIPSLAGYHTGLEGPFVLLETAEQHRRFGYVESQGLGFVISDAPWVSTLGLRYGKLRSKALQVDESAALIERLLEGHDDD
ncbi:helix-turn-helix transcriptional regulator [Streptomyces smyrnaeus]|uniref:helix-turn-helix domain-containing protein n=1 Tax=Streptomyces smyrnaeus TaxID=1387713 RepID=UPI0033A8CA05